MTTHAIGVDIGGSGVKGALVDLTAGELAGDRVRIPTPRPSTPEAIADTVAEVVDAVRRAAPQVPAGLPVGVTVPGVVVRGTVLSAANIDPSWVGTDAATLFGERLGTRVALLNDADAAGVAEMRHGAAKGVGGLVIITTLGTGIGSAFLHDGVLVPNSELGHLEIDGAVAESRAAASVREAEGLSWSEWAARLQRYYAHVERLFTPDLFVVGGGVSKHADKYLPLLDLRTPIVPAARRNRAGIIGAATVAAGD